MFFALKPNRESIAAFIAAQKNCEISYAEVGCTRDMRPPNRYNVDHNRVRLGQGPEAYEKAKEAIRRWKMFDMPWLELCWPVAPIQVGTTVAVAVSHFGFWSLNACRIVYTVEEQEPLEKYGFAYGTLGEHAEIGEERFSVEFYRSERSVWYDLYAVSRPGAVAQIAYPLARLLQRRFAKDSLRAMHKFVQDD